MPKLSVWFVRSALVHLMVGFTIGALVLVQKGTGKLPWSWALLGWHVDTLLVGWMTQLAMGIAYWILPRFGTRRGKVGFALAAWVAVNAGVLGSGVVLLAQAPTSWLALTRGSEGLGVVLFALHAWPRVKPAMTAEERTSSS